MEALLLELQETATNPTPISDRPLPDKMGSFVMPGEEQFTTNIFVGNLAPITTEEELTEVFRQFGETCTYCNQNALPTCYPTLLPVSRLMWH